MVNGQLSRSVRTRKQPEDGGADSAIRARYREPYQSNENTENTPLPGSSAVALTNSENTASAFKGLLLWRADREWSSDNARFGQQAVAVPYPPSRWD